MKTARVLMLGWEFPPLMAGGLGVACYGLARALAKKVELDVIVPKSDPNAAYDDFALQGLNNIRTEDLEKVEKHYRYESFAHVRHIPLNLNPYETGLEGEELRKYSEMVDEWEQMTKTTQKQLDLMEIGDLYGDDIGEKVVEFSKIVAKLAMQRDFDVVHAHDWVTYLGGVEIKKATGKPLVVHLHASQYDRAGADARGWIYDIERYGMEEADRVIPVSRYTGQIVTGHYGIDPEKVRPIHNGAEPVETFTKKKKFPEKLVLFLGRLTAQKGPEFFLEIASRVVEKNPNVRFVMAGTGEKLKQLIETGAFKGLGGKFHFTGFLDKQKVNDLLAITDIYCMPSVSEPFGLSALEAAQFGIPAVISKQSGVAEVLQGALKADFWDTELMAQHINNLLTDDELRESVVKQAQRDMASATWDASAERVIDVYNEVLS